MYNIKTGSQRINPSNPMSLHIENKDHDKQKLPFKMTHDYSHFHKIVLRSEDKISGTNIDARFRINLQTDIPKSAVVNVESFTIWGNPTPVGEEAPYAVSIPELQQPKSYDTKTNNLTNFLFQSNSTLYQNPASTSSLGIPLTDQNFFNNMFSVKIEELTGSAIEEYVGGWILVLNIYEVSNAEI